MPEIAPVLLHSFVVMAEELSFSRAASRLYVAQPALSQRISRLEELTGLRLFERTTRKVELTRQGEALLPEAQNYLEADRLLQYRVSALAKGKTEHLRIGYTPSTGYEITPHLAARFTHEHPWIEVEAKESWYAELVLGLRQGTIDVGLTRSRPDSPDLDAELVREERLVLMMDETHPLSSRSGVTLDELKNELFMFFPEQLESGYYEALVELCRTAGFEPKTVDNPLPGVRSFDMLKQAGAVALRPASTRLMHPRGIAFIDIEDPSAFIPCYTIWSQVRKSNADAIARWRTNARSVSEHHGWLPQN